MKKLIIDCDNTLGEPGCDVDDGLAIIYALGTNQVDLLGLTTTFGNSNIYTVNQRTRELKDRIGLDCPIHYGAQAAGDHDTAAARFLVQAANDHPDQLEILATGSLTNLLAAWRLDENFFGKLKSVSLMGGLTGPLIFADKELKELNFACDPEASFAVIENSPNLLIATGNNCLGALFTASDFQERKAQAQGKLAELYRDIEYWFDREADVFANPGIYKWDVFAAAALLHPSYFDKNLIEITPDLASLATGNLLGDGRAIAVSLPKVIDSQAYIDHVYATYPRAFR